MTHTTLPPALAALALSACATTAMPPSGNDGDPPVSEPQGECDAAPVQDMIGARASEATGARLLERTGARTLRWVPPRTAVTMDFRPGRLTVSYDDDLVIERISCG